VTRGPVPLLELDQVSHRYRRPPTGSSSRPRRGGLVLDDVSVRLEEGRTLALVGESGCGKTTLARCAVRLLDPSGGSVRFRGDDVTGARGRRLRAFRGSVQMVFQDPTASLNPRRRTRAAVEATLDVYGVDRARRPERARELLRLVGLGQEHEDRLPHELSGGERQRVAIARALATSPSAIVLDEPTSSLDAVTQARILNLLADLRDELRLAYLLISHDLGLVAHLADRIAVMRAGRLVETAPTRQILSSPADSYTGTLIAAAPQLPPAPDIAASAAVATGAGRETRYDEEETTWS
jgi:ABC-type glutathione transport system ATPase component